jgi:hypothetical protein
MTDDDTTIRAVLGHYQRLYRSRDVTRIDEAMALFATDDDPVGAPEMVGTEAARRGDPDWAVGRDAVRALTVWDWRSWYEVEFDLAAAHITVQDDTAWVTMPGALVQSERAREGTERLARETTLGRLRTLLGDEERPLQERLDDMAHLAGLRARELRAPLGHRRALTFTAVLVRRPPAWLLHTTHWAIAAE